MKVTTMWVDYSSTPGELVPTIVLAVDEYADDENPSYWNDAFERERKRAEGSGYGWRVIDLIVNEDVILNAFDIPEVPTTVEVRVEDD